MSLSISLIDPGSKYETQDLYWGNITHNLNSMAEAAGIYKVLWRPEEIGFKYAFEITDILEKGLIDLINRPGYYKIYNSPNGWGLYENFVPFVEEYLIALKKYPDAIIKVSR